MLRCTLFSFMTKKQRAQKIDRAIKLAYSSLESHLGYTHQEELNKGETNAFHQKCVKEYSEIIKILSELY